jgi:hypothetical protein
MKALVDIANWPYYRMISKKVNETMISINISVIDGWEENI